MFLWGRVLPVRVLLFVGVLLVAACTNRVPAPVQPEALASANLTQVFVATNRGRNADGYFGRARETGLTFLDTQVSIPPVHEIGDAPRYHPDPNLNKHFVLASEDQYASKQAFISDLRQRLSKLPPENREISVYVHGYYNGYADSVFRMAQMYNDFEMKGVPIAFSWPSAAKGTGYAFDRDSALFSRDELEELLLLLPQTGARNILIMAHSMGSLLVVETLRQMDISRPGWAKANIEGVVLMSPDISVDVFRAQASRIKFFPEPFIVIASKKDKILKLSTRVSLEEDRLGLGNSVEQLSDLPVIFLDVTDFNKDSANPHFVAAESPALISILGSLSDLPGYTRAEQATFLGGLAQASKHIENALELELTVDSDNLR